MGRAIQANNLLEYPDPRLPTLEGAPEWVTGPLVIEHVTTRWGAYTRYTVGRWTVDPTTISPLN